MNERLDLKAKCGTYRSNIFSIKLLYDRSLSGVIKTAEWQTRQWAGDQGTGREEVTHRNRILISRSFCRFFRIMVNKPMAGKEWCGLG